MTERPTYTVHWFREREREDEAYVCTGLTERDLVRRLIGAVQTSGPIRVVAVERER